ncbi:MAG TPA: EAL domain-containing protein [Polyangiaceae bacterium]|nr:EAL domain-containing protein [Polyangiaceae bacterium]
MLKPQPAERPGAARLLLVDDDELLLKATKRVLEQRGYHVVACSRGDAAIGWLDRDAFDVLISDVQMPGFSGLRLLREVRLRELDMPVVLMTGNPEVETAAAAIEHRAFQYLIKPVPPERLFDAVERALTSVESTQAQAGEPSGVQRRKVAGTPDTEQAPLSTERLAFQPIVRALDSTTYGYEVVSSGDSLAMRSRVVDVVAASSRDCGFLVKVSSKRLSRADLFDPAAPLSRHARSVVLDVTESTSLLSQADLRNRIGRLRELGFRIALDLGAGYAALSNFASLEPELVKLDPSIIEGIHLSRAKQQVARSLACLCGEMGQTLLANGIATPDERAVLTALGCDLLQGPLLGEAIQEPLVLSLRG